MMMRSSTPSLNPDWHILGLGSIGGLFACRMQSAGISVAACPSLSHAGNNHVPLTLEENGQTTSFSIPVQSDTVIERLLLTTKAQQSEAAMRSIADRLADNAIVVVLQNGLGVHAWLSREFPTLCIVAGTTTEGANRPTPQHIRHAGYGTTWLGPWRPQDADAAHSVFTQWQALPMQIAFDPAISARLWEKLVMNCAINPLTALLGYRNGELKDHAEIRRIMHAVVNEVSAVMQASGQAADAQLLYQKVLDVSERTGANISSMLQDMRAGRPTEIDFINGYVAKQATALKVEAPVNRWLTECVVERRQFTLHALTQAFNDSLG